MARVTRALGRHPAMADAALAAALLVAMTVVRHGWTRMATEPKPAMGFGFSVAIAGAVATRRRLPLASYCAGSAALALESLIVGPSQISPYANLIGIYSAGLYVTSRWAWLAPATVPVGMAAYFVGVGSTTIVAAAGVLFSWWLAWALGHTTALRRVEQEAAQAVLRHKTVVEERTRIARELHDLIGHTVTLMLVQTGAARMVVGRDVDKARELLAVVERTGHEALTELDRVLGVLRQDAEQDVVGLADLPRLAEHLAGAGMAVDMCVGEEVGEVPTSMGLSTYRIVQEALTNAVRHGRATSARVTVTHTGGVLRVEVVDDGRGGKPGYTDGRGLLGIRERAAVFGGSVEHGGGEGGGFRLRVLLPVP